MKGRRGKAQVQDPVWSHFAENRSLVSGSPIRGNGDDWRTGSGEREEEVQDPVWLHFAENRSLVSGSLIWGNGDDWRTGSGELEEGEFLSWYWLQDWLKVGSAGAQKRKCWKGSLASSSKVGEGHYAVRWLGRMLGQVVAAAPLQRECRVYCQL